MPARTQYNEKLAKDILIAKIDQEASAKQPGVDNGLARPAAWDCAGHDDFDRYLAIWSVDNMIIHDCHCEDSGGSMLIAMANVIRLCNFLPTIQTGVKSPMYDTIIDAVNHKNPSKVLAEGIICGKQQCYFRLGEPHYPD